MRTFHLRPIAPLRPYIDRFWGWESAAGETVPLPTLLPGTGAEVFFHFRTPFCGSSAHLLYVRTQPLALPATDNIGFVAVRFRAGMLHRFTVIPGAELMDRACTVDAMWGRDGTELAERVAGAATFAAKAQLIQAFLLKRMQAACPDPLVEYAISRIYRDCAAISIAQLADRIGIGKRQLERRFKALTGQAPAEMRRISRVQKAVRMLLLDPAVRSADVALAHGYYDQAHFIRDFNALVRTSPQRFIDAARQKTHFYNTPWNSNGNMTTLINRT